VPQQSTDARILITAFNFPTTVANSLGSFKSRIRHGKGQNQLHVFLKAVAPMVDRLSTQGGFPVGISMMNTYSQINNYL
jgi:hypothetical protein